MSLRNLPPSERLTATLAILALAAFLGGGLAFVAGQERAARAATAPPPAQSRLMAVLEGVMAPNVSAGEAAVFRTWIQGGATREAYAPVDAVVSNNCASCHSPGGQYPRLTTFEDLRPLALETAGGSLYAMLGARTLHFVAFPLVFLVAAFAYLRRAAWTGRRMLMGACAAAVLFNAGQWWLRQGHPGHAWAPWTALGLLAVAFLALTAVVLAELWRGTTEGKS
ncbi:MAG TPA: hypothetical protein VFV26_07000 [Geothrix sp.]|nr:hypothetical protein [Geothrix sp.]